MIVKRLALVTAPGSHGDAQTIRSRDRIGFWLVALVLLLLPIERPELPLRLEVADVALVLVTLYSFAKAWHTHQRLKLPLLVPMWLILLSSLTATLAGSAHADSFTAIEQELYLFVWFFAMLNLLVTFPSSDLDQLMKIWSVIALAEAATAVMGMLHLGPRIFYQAPDAAQLGSSAGLGRALGTYTNPNAAGAYLSVSFFAVLAAPWSFRSRLALGLGILAGMFGTGSMGALLPTMISLTVLLLFPVAMDRQSITSRGGLAGVGVGILGLLVPILRTQSLFFSELVTNQRLLSTTIRRLPRSLASRLAILSQAWSTYTRHPWGVGPGRLVDTTPALHSMHNDYFSFLFERGPIGALGLVWMIGAALLAPLEAASRLTDRHKRWQVLALGAGFLACALNAVTHEVTHFRQVWVLLTFLFAVTYGHSRESMVDAPAGPEQVDARELA